MKIGFHNLAMASVAATLVAGFVMATSVGASPRIDYGYINGVNVGTDACRPDDVYNGLKQAHTWGTPVNLAVRGVTSRVPWRVEDNKEVGTFGYTRVEAGGTRRFHAGTDLLGDVGEPVLAVASGKIVAAGSSASIGNYVILRTSFIVPPALPCAVDVVYAHLQSASVTQNQEVSEGTEIGKMGRTGNLSDDIPTHLHIELWVAPYLPGLDARKQRTRDIMGGVFRPAIPGLGR
jgi:murein DD-endopeptidase MepM/ murein hydrolase activator NlpD